MSTAADDESALIIACPEAEPAVGAHRQRCDLSARLGVPAHITVTYPFMSAHAMTAAEHDAVERVMGRFDRFSLSGAETGWFDESVLFVAIKDPESVAAITDAVASEFPEFPPYGGAFDEVVPHLTIGHDRPHDVLSAVEREVSDHLPFVQVVDHVELWSGPAVATATAGEWRWVRDYRLR